MEHRPSTSRLARRLQAGRRHSVNVPCASSYQNVPVKHLFNPTVVYLGTHPLERHCNEEMETREAYLPSLHRARHRGNDTPAFNSKIRTKNCINTWTWDGSSNEENTPPVDPKSLPLPEITRNPRTVSRRHTLSVITEIVDATDVSSVSSRETKDENNPLPQITQAEKHNSPQQRFRYTRDPDRKVTAVGNKIPGKHDRAQALQKHIEKAEARYRNGHEMKAARLFEWLKDQANSNETILTR